jgi:hypothetical protein
MSAIRGYFALMTLSLASVALADPVYTPARLGEGEKSIEALLQLPKLEPGTYSVHCEAVVRKSGALKHLTCYQEGDPPRKLQDLPLRVARSGRSARLIPATRDGKPVDAFMLLMLRIHVTSHGSQVLVVPNNGVEVERYGLLYTAPQRLNEFEWRGSRLMRDCVVWTWMQIDERGKVASYRVDRDSGADSKFLDEVEQQIQRMEFMPGLYQGKPVPMVYVEPIYWLW